MKTLVLNGWAASAAAWDRCRFARDAEVLSYVECLDGLDRRRLDAIAAAGERALLVGWSMGGCRALHLACERPDAIGALVLVAATPRMMEDPATGWRGMNERRLSALRKGLELTGGRGFFGTPEGGPSPYLMDAPENLERGLAYLRRTDLREPLERNFRGVKPPFPVAIVHAVRDPVVRPENAEWLAGLFEGASLSRPALSEHALPAFAAAEIDAAIARTAGFLL